MPRNKLGYNTAHASPEPSSHTLGQPPGHPSPTNLFNKVHDGVVGWNVEGRPVNALPQVVLLHLLQRDLCDDLGTESLRQASSRRVAPLVSETRHFLRQFETRQTYLMKFLITKIDDQLLKTVCFLDFETEDIEQTEHLPAAERPHLQSVKQG